MTILHILIIITLTCISSLAYPIIKSIQTSKSALFVSKHHSRYGQFLDTLPITNRKDPKIERLTQQLNVNELITTMDKSYSKGSDLKKNSPKSLKTIKKLQPEPFNYFPELKQRKWSNEQIYQVIDILNQSYDHKERNELTDEERVGVIDWDKFDTIATLEIDNYMEDMKIRKKVKSWIIFHREKREILFQENAWIWKPRALKRRYQKA